jgi:hypothetical protein
MGEEASSDVTEEDTSGTPVTEPQGTGDGRLVVSNMCVFKREVCRIGG